MTYEQKLERISEFAENEAKRVSRHFRNVSRFERLELLCQYSTEVKEAIDGAIKKYRAAVLEGVDSPWLEYGETAFENLLVLEEMLCQMILGVHETHLSDGEGNSEDAKASIDKLFEFVQKIEQDSEGHSPEGGQS